MTLNEQLFSMKKLTAILEGKKYQSPLAAGALLVSKETGKCLVGLRSKRCDSPHTWGPFGGSIEKGESIKEGLLRELREEIGFNDDVELHESWTFERENFKYHTFIGLVEKEFEPKLNDETDEVKWLTLEELIDLPKKHSGFAEFIENAKEDLEKYLVDEETATATRKEKWGKKLKALYKRKGIREMSTINENNFMNVQPFELIQFGQWLEREGYQQYDGWDRWIDVATKKVENIETLFAEFRKTLP